MTATLDDVTNKKPDAPAEAETAKELVPAGPGAGLVPDRAGWAAEAADPPAGAVACSYSGRPAEGRCSNPKPLRQHLSQRQAELMVRNQQAVEHGSGQSPAIVPGGRADPWTGVLRAPCSCVGFDVLHNDDDLPVRTLRDRVPDGQAVRR